MGNTPTKTVNYAIPIYNEDKKDNETFIYRAPEFANVDPMNKELEFRTLHELYNKYFSEYPNDDAFGHRLKNEDGSLANVFTWLSKTEVKEQCNELASGMVNLNLANKNNRRSLVFQNGGHEALPSDYRKTQRLSVGRRAKRHGYAGATCFVALA